MRKDNQSKENKCADPFGESEKMTYSGIQSQVQFLQGKILTIIDASIAEGTQKNAVKSLINKAVSDQLTWIRQICYKDVQMMTSDQAHSLIEDLPEVIRNAEDA